MAYQMTLDDWAWLRGDDGQALLAHLAERAIVEADLIGHLTRLGKRYGQSRAAAAVETAWLRQKARAKFERAGDMYFVREALEQASGEVVARHKAQRFRRCRRVADLGCGIGGDTIALGEVAPVLAVERDELRLRMAAANAAAYGVAGQLEAVCADWTRLDLAGQEALYLDPSRRAGDKRAFSIHEYEPPLSILPALARLAPAVAAKIAPGVRYDELVRLGVEAEWEFISHEGECKEAVLWCGDLKTCGRRATLLPGGHTLTDQALAEPIAVGKPGSYLYEPDGAVIRAHLVEQLAAAEGLHKIHPEIAYLSGDRLVETPFARAYRVEEAHPFHLKRLKERLRQLDVGRLVVKKRGFPVDPEAFRKQLKLDGSQAKVLILTRVEDRPTMLICSWNAQDALAG